MNELTYKRYGDYQLPEIKIKQCNGRLGKYGAMRKQFLKEHKPMTYDDMILSETLFPHLLEVQEIASQRLELLMKQLLEQNPAPDEKNSQMDWVKYMNTLKVQAEEMVLSELVYC